MRYRQAMLVGVVLAVGGLAAAPPEPETGSLAGKRVMVIGEAALIRVDRRPARRVPFGTVLSVSKVEGDRLSISGLAGWMRVEDVVAYDKAVEYLTGVIKRKPTAKAYRRRGMVRAMRRDDKLAVVDLDEALKRDSTDVLAYNLRGNVLRRLRLFDRALADFNTLVKRKVVHPAVYTNRGLVWYDKGDFDRALADFNAAVRLDSRFAPALEAAGGVRRAQGEFKKAINNYKSAIRWDPNFHRALNNLAWLLATCPEKKRRSGRNAVKYATKACELTGFRDSGYLDTLAAALAERGKFKQSVKHARQAITLADEAVRPDIQKRLELYLAEKPYHESDE